MIANYYATSNIIFRYSLKTHVVCRTDNRAPGTWTPTAIPEKDVCPLYSAVPVSRDEAYAILAKWKAGVSTQGIESEPDFEKKSNGVLRQSKYRKPTSSARERLKTLEAWMQTPEAQDLVRQQEEKHAKNSERAKKWHAKRDQGRAA